MPDDPSVAVERANEAIRDYVRAHPHPDTWTRRQHDRFDLLLDAFNDARRRLDAAREAETEPEPAAA